MRSGLTLIELLVVLVILVALTGIAVQSLGPVADQARYEATQRTLININEAIVSRTLTPDRVASYSGFVADMGRLPVAVGVDPETQLAELWTQGGLQSFTVTPNFNDTGDVGLGLPELTGEAGIPVAAGWRGPYLSLPPGPSVLRDGYGRAFGIVPGVENAPIVNVISAGANGALAPTDVDYDRDLELPGGAWAPGRFQGAVNVTLKEANGVDDPSILEGETLRVRLYGPAAGVPSLLSEVAGAEDSDALDDPTTTAFSGLITDQSIGPRAIVGYVTTGSGPYTVLRQSLAKQIVVAPGMNPPVQLNLSPP